VSDLGGGFSTGGDSVAATVGREQIQPGVGRRDTGAVAVVIPSAARAEQLGRCLDALAGQRLRPREIVVIGPGMDRTDGMMSRWPGTRGISCPGPFSFSRVVNRGIAATTGAWVLFLNDDVVLRSGFIEQLLRAIPADARIGMVCGKLLASDGRTIDSTGQYVSRARTARERGYRAVDVGQFDEPGYVFSVPGAAALYRRRMLEALAVRGQCFDENLGMYLEDLDLGWRAQRAGWRAYYVPDACATHTRGASAKPRRPRWSYLRRYYLPWLSPALQARYIINRYTLIRKYDAWWRLLRDSPWILWYEVRLWAYLIGVERRTLRLLWRILPRAVAARATRVVGPSAQTSTTLPNGM